MLLSLRLGYTTCVHIPPGHRRFRWCGIVAYSQNLISERFICRESTKHLTTLFVHVRNVY